MMSYKGNDLNALFLHIITFSLPLFNSSITKLPNEFSRDLAIQILQHTNNITVYVETSHRISYSCNYNYGESICQ